ncbi:MULTISPECIES: YqjF family protein [Salinibaculum]|uniref:YqjF family protein n=1 Tax=Salinibaculum TaxID=2732368 RepID=UPI0030D3077F
MPAFEMEWRDVLFASYPVDPAVVRPHVPERFELDTFEGDAYLSVVPFVIADIRPKGLPAALGLTTPELNLRTYVTCDGAPGVYFFNLDADDVLGVLGARLFNQLPYYFADMEYDPGPPIRFESRRTTPGARPCRFAGTYGPDGDPFQPEPGTREHFLTERYRYFTETGNGTVRYADIEHEPWTLSPATWDVRENTIFAANGFDEPDADPVLSYSRGVTVSASTSKQWARN